jgi:hypothetical protein
MSTLTHPAIARPMTQAEADALCAALHAISHITVGAHVNAAGYVAVWPVGHAITTAEEVATLRAFCFVTDVPVRWCSAASA